MLFVFGEAGAWVDFRVGGLADDYLAFGSADYRSVLVGVGDG